MNPILQANLNFLFAQCPHGEKKLAAARIGVTQSTLSNWLSGEQEMRPKYITALLAYFSLPDWLPITDVRLTPQRLTRYRLAQQITTLPDEQLLGVAQELLGLTQAWLTETHGKRCHR
jgi:hypothetical protein